MTGAGHVRVSAKGANGSFTVQVKPGLSDHAVRTLAPTEQPCTRPGDIPALRG